MKNELKKFVSVIIFIGILIILYLCSLYSYLLFHTIAEIFSICIAFAVFLILWNSLRYMNNNYLILVGIAYFFIGFIDLFHTLSFKGMQIFKDYDYYATQFWIAARFFESITLLFSLLYVKTTKKINPYLFFSICTFLTTGVIFSVLIWKNFPACFISGIGLTPFKIYSEYVICIILVAAIMLLNKHKGAFEGIIYRYLFLSMVCTIISELAFTTYIDNYDSIHLVGHYFKIISFYFIYKAIIVKAIQEPQEIIFREIKQNENKLFEQNLILKDQATIDGLTGLYNHRFIYERLAKEASRCNRNNSTFVVMILDVDHFKRINDTYGYLTGDQILMKVAQMLRSNTKQTDLVGRYGGEEFLIMLVDTKLKAGFEVAEKIRQVIEASEFIEKIRITISIGIEEYKGEPISTLLNKADKKLYTAKGSGRNKTVM